MKKQNKTKKLAEGILGPNAERKRKAPWTQLTPQRVLPQPQRTWAAGCGRRLELLGCMWIWRKMWTDLSVLTLLFAKASDWQTCQFPKISESFYLQTRYIFPEIKETVAFIPGRVRSLGLNFADKIKINWRYWNYKTRHVAGPRTKNPKLLLLSLHHVIPYSEKLPFKIFSPNWLGLVIIDSAKFTFYCIYWLFIFPLQFLKDGFPERWDNEHNMFSINIKKFLPKQMYM